MVKINNHKIPESLQLLNFKNGDMSEPEAIPIINLVYPIEYETELYSVRNSNSDGTIYTAPTGRKVYIRSLMLSCAAVSYGMGYAKVSFIPYNGERQYVTININMTQDVAPTDRPANEAISMQFGRLRIKDGTTVDIHVDSSMTANAAIEVEVH